MAQKTLYVILVRPEYGIPSLLTRGFITLDAAQRFIEQRSDTPRQETSFLYKGRNCEYEIDMILYEE